MGYPNNDPYGFIPKCVHCDDAGCERCCPTEPVTLSDLDMMDALQADGEKLRAMTGEEHGPMCPRCLVNPVDLALLGTDEEGHICGTCWTNAALENADGWLPDGSWAPGG